MIKFLIVINNSALVKRHYFCKCSLFRDTLLLLVNILPTYLPLSIAVSVHNVAISFGRHHQRDTVDKLENCKCWFTVHV